MKPSNAARQSINTTRRGPCALALLQRQRGGFHLRGPHNKHNPVKAHVFIYGFTRQHDDTIEYDCIVIIVALFKINRASVLVYQARSEDSTGIIRSKERSDCKCSFTITAMPQEEGGLGAGGGRGEGAVGELKSF